MRASLFLCSLGCVFGAAAFAQAPAPSAKVEIHVGDRPALVPSDEDLLNMPRHTVRATEHDKQFSYEGVLLHDVLERAGAPLGSQLRGKALSTYVLATGRDGYAVVYALPEFDSAFTDSDIIIADKSNGQLLAGEQGPLRIVVPHDKKPARSLRMLERIDVVQLMEVNPRQRSYVPLVSSTGLASQPRLFVWCVRKSEGK
jgi:hypothetical protein